MVTHPVTLIEGLVMEEIADALAAAQFGDRETFLALMQDASSIQDLDSEATNLEGYLYPDTYRFARGTSEGCGAVTSDRNGGVLCCADGTANPGAAAAAAPAAADDAKAAGGEAKADGNSDAKGDADAAKAGDKADDKKADKPAKAG